jgi:hypothetical protein
MGEPQHQESKNGFMASTCFKTWGSICMKFELFMQASNKSFIFDN